MEENPNNVNNINNINNISDKTEINEKDLICQLCLYLNNMQFLERVMPQIDFLARRQYIMNGGNYCCVYFKQIKNINIKNCN